MKQLLIIILIGSSLFSMEEKKVSLSPIQKLSLVDSIRKGSLVIHQDFYECSSFINDTTTHKSTYIIHRKRSNEYLQEFLKTETNSRRQLQCLCI